MNPDNISSGTAKVSESNKNSANNIDFDKTKWNCMTSKALLACYFKHFKEEEENNDGTIRSEPAEKKELICSPEEYQQSIPILRERFWHGKLCECLYCSKMYQDDNVSFLFGIKNIECLPTEMLLKIFPYLLPSDRRVASECCKRFLEIWLCDVFIDDRRLVFNKCVLDKKWEPLSTFSKSQSIYHTLAFGDVIMRGESIFAGKFGENVTTVELLKEFRSFDCRFLSQFPNLKTIKVANRDVLGNFSNVPAKIELLEIFENDMYDGDELNIVDSNYLEKTSDLFRVELNYTMIAEQILSFTESQRKKIKSKSIFLEAHNNTFKLPRFVNLKHIKLFFDDTCQYGTEAILDNLEVQLPALVDLSISISGRLPHKNWSCLKTLDIRYIRELSRLNIFKNLEELAVRTCNQCSFVHKTFLNSNLKKLKIISPGNGLCFTCFQTMLKSFPKLENLTCNFQVTNNHLGELATNTTKLKYLKLQSVVPTVSFDCLPNLIDLDVINALTIHMVETWPLMFQLRKLHIRLSRLNLDTVKVFERTPALESLSIGCDHIDGDQLALFEMMTKPLKRLRNFFFSCERIEPGIYPQIIDMMANNCKYLQRINFFNFDTFSPYASKQILEKLLQKHSSIRYIDSVWLK